MLKILNSIRIVEQGTFITGPCAAMMLADLGADVIKLESPGEGDPYRNFRGGLYSAHFQAYNRNKRSICLDLKSPGDRELFRELVENADVYIQNFRPGVASRIGAGYDDLAKLNPRLIYCSISGFGQTGPYAARPSYDSVTQALSGFLAVAIDPKYPRILGPALADAITGIYAALGIAAALVERGATGKGRLLEISMIEAMMHFSIEPFAGYFALGDEPTGLDRPRLAQAYIVGCRDGRLIGLHLSSVEKFWTNLVDAVGDENFKNDPRFHTRQNRIDNYFELQQRLHELFASRDRNEWIEHLGKFDLPFAPVNTISEAVRDQQANHMGMFVPVEQRREGAEKSVRAAFTFDGQRDQFVNAAPLLDQHGATIRASLKEAPGIWPVLQNPCG